MKSISFPAARHTVFRRLLLAMLFIVAGIASSCTSNTSSTESRTDLLVKRTWKFDSVSPDPTGFGQLFRGLTLQYNRNGQVTITFASLGSATGTWRLQNNDTQIVVN
jgi:hypothetical protein